MELRRKKAPSPPKPSRLQPSEPLHMTTRAASKAGSNGSNGSNSRRGSLISNGLTSPIPGNDDDNERYSKRRRVSTASRTTPTKPPSAASRPSTRKRSILTLIEETPTMTKKRKRSADQSTKAESYSPPQTKTERSSTSSQEGASTRSLRSSDVSAKKVQLEPKTAIVFDEPDESHEKRTRVSDASIAASSSSQEDGDLNGSSLNESVGHDAQVDGENDDEKAAEVGPLLGEEIKDSLEVAPPTLDPTPAESASRAGSPPDSSFDRESPVKRADAAALAEDGVGKKKLPGRRRAPHPNPKVEAALRRQLHLRMNYRAVAKSLKPVLAELAQRSLKELETNPTAHEESSEYPAVKEGLHQSFERRLAWIQKQKELNKQRLKDMLEAEMEMRRTQYDNVARNMQEMHVIRLQHDFLTAVRKQECQDDGYASDDENENVIPPLRHVTAKGTVKHILGPEFHWRSRPAVETERLFNEMYQRHLVVREQREHNGGLDYGRAFTTFDPTVRDSARIAKTVETLVLALEEAQKVPVVLPPISNNEAYGLQALANASAATAATDAAMREAEEQAKVQAISQPSPLSVPKPSLSQPPDDVRLHALMSVPTSVQSSVGESRWPPEASRSEQNQQQQPVHLPISQPSRPATTFSQVALEPSLTETAPSSMPPPHPIIPGLSFFPQAAIPGLDSHLPQTSSAANHDKPPSPGGYIPDPPAAPRPAESRAEPKTPSSEGFWDRLSKPAKDTGPSRAKTPRESIRHSPIQPMTDPSGIASALHAGVEVSSSRHTFGRTSDQSQEHPHDHIQERIRELTQERHEDSGEERHQQNQSSSRPPLTVSSIALESLSQKLRSTNDSFGPTDYQPKQKKRAPKTSLHGPWPRSRNYDPLKNERDRRASTGTARVSNYGAPDNRYPPYHTQPPPPFPVPAPYAGAGYAPPLLQHPPSLPPPPPPQYVPIPPPYGYDQRSSHYQQPTGYSSLPGPLPMVQPPPNAGYYHGLPPPPPPPPLPLYAPTHQSPYLPIPPHQPPLAARPPVGQSPYGPQYGGQPILPANPGSTAYGPNGAAHGSPPTGHSRPAFAQYQRDDGRRHDYGGRGGRGRHSAGQQEWKQYQTPR